MLNLFNSAALNRERGRNLEEGIRKHRAEPNLGRGCKMQPVGLELQAHSIHNFHIWNLNFHLSFSYYIYVRSFTRRQCYLPHKK